MSQALTLEKQRIAELDCSIVNTSRSSVEPGLIVILCHGFGAPGDDLVPCSREIYLASNSEEMDRVRFVFPAAPIELDGGFGDSRAWWPIDMVALQVAMATGNIRDLRNDEPAMLAERRKSMLGLIDQLKMETGLAERNIVLGGFSQGAMVATDVALNMQHPPGGLIVWSGTLLNERHWKELALDREATHRFPVFQCHGRTDPVLPFEGAEWLREMFRTAQFDLEFLPFGGQHTIPAAGIEAAAKLIESMLEN